MHDRLVIIGHTSRVHLSNGPFFEIVFLSLDDLAPYDLDVGVSVESCLFVIEADQVPNLMQKHTFLQTKQTNTRCQAHAEEFLRKQSTSTLSRMSCEKTKFETTTFQKERVKQKHNSKQYRTSKTLQDILVVVLSCQIVWKSACLLFCSPACNGTKSDERSLFFPWAPGFRRTNCICTNL